ncbi:MAG: hypothetical protein WBK43_01895 [Prolixibacteraceae bacterium]|jgi:lysine 2,3-aminomutase|nr:hypothetical protein [Bacteroidota bacterium]NLT00131.1 hypothetical protein [Bacteroidales bacterium]HOF56430.1 hypothetical protein [Prolixibacteraceae bacterium]HOS01261.1 hypothetical protein [Prolixibacteraceae bacterium]HOS91281.1 hypothetical protein [Prolixibacteraceae bacterium]
MDAVRIMDAFIGRPGVFLPRVILVDSKGNHLGTTNRTWLPTFEKSRKAELLDYELTGTDMALTNPPEQEEELENAYRGSRLFRFSPDDPQG